MRNTSTTTKTWVACGVSPGMRAYGDSHLACVPTGTLTWHACYVFWALINSLMCWFCTNALVLVLFENCGTANCRPHCIIFALKLRSYPVAIYTLHAYFCSELLNPADEQFGYIHHQCANSARLSLRETGEQQGMPVTQARPSHALKNKGLWGFVSSPYLLCVNHDSSDLLSELPFDWLPSWRCVAGCTGWSETGQWSECVRFIAV